MIFLLKYEFILSKPNISLYLSSITGETDTDLELFLHDDEIDFEPEEIHNKKAVIEKPACDQNTEISLKSNNLNSNENIIKSSEAVSPFKCPTDVQTAIIISDKPSKDALAENVSIEKSPKKSVLSSSEIKDVVKDSTTNTLESDLYKAKEACEVNEAIANIAEFISDPIYKENHEESLTKHVLTNEEIVVSKNVNETTPSKAKPTYFTNETEVGGEKVQKDSSMPKPKVLDFTSQEDELQLHFDEDLLDFNSATSPMKATISKPDRDINSAKVENKINLNEAISAEPSNKDGRSSKVSLKAPNLKATRLTPSCDALSPKNMSKYKIPKTPKEDLKEKNVKEIDRKHDKGDRKDKSMASRDERRRDVEKDSDRRKDRNDQSKEKETDRRREKDNERRRDKDEKFRERDGERRRDREERSREKDDHKRKKERDEKSREKDIESDGSKTNNDLKTKAREKDNDRDWTKSRKRERSISPVKPSNFRRERRRSNRSRSR